MIWLAIIFCFCIAFVFSGIEAGILSVSRVRLRHHAQRNDEMAGVAIKLERLLARPERLMTTVLLVINFANVAAFALWAHEAVRYFGNAGYVIAPLLYLPFYLIGIELLPKSLFRRFPFRALARMAELLRLTDRLLSPFLAAGGWLMRQIFPRRSAKHRKLFVAREDFKYLAIESERQGVLTGEERRMIHNVVDFQNVKAREIMQPLTAITLLQSTMTMEEALAAARAAESDFLPVMNERGETVATVNVFDMLLDSTRDSSLRRFMQRAITVSENEPLPTIIRKLRSARSMLAVVNDANRHPVGCVSFDALIRRLINPPKPDMQ